MQKDRLHSSPAPKAFSTDDDGELDVWIVLAEV